MKIVIALAALMLMVICLPACITLNTGGPVTTVTTTPPSTSETITTPATSTPPATATIPALTNKPTLPVLPTGTKKVLEDKTWILHKYGTPGALQDTVEGKEATARFDSSSNLVIGSGGCNSYHAPYTKNNDKLTIGLITATEVFCYGGLLNQQEFKFLDALKGAQSFTIDLTELKISCTDNRLLIFRAK